MKYDLYLGQRPWMLTSSDGFLSLEGDSIEDAIRNYGAEALAGTAVAESIHIISVDAITTEYSAGILGGAGGIVAHLLCTVCTAYAETSPNYRKHEKTCDLWFRDAKQPKPFTRLAYLRGAAGLTQQAVADSAGVNIRLYQKYERGDVGISLVAAGTVARIARVLGTTVEDLLKE